MNYWRQSKNYIYVAAHRGWSEKYPENTMLAYRKAAELGVELVDLSVIIDGETKQSRDVDIKEFYAFLRNKGVTTTSAVNLETIKDAMAPFVSQGKDVLYLSFSSGLSTTYNASRMAAEEMMEA